MAKDVERPENAETGNGETSEIRVKDRRRFSAEGEPIDTQEEREEKPGDSAPQAETAAAGTKAEQVPQSEAPKAHSASTHPLPPASFEMLVVSLAMQAQMELSAGGDGGAIKANPEIARHTIDLLAVLQEKTKGNLSLEEDRLLENTLTELRFRYVQVIEEINKKAKGSS